MKTILSWTGLGLVLHFVHSVSVAAPSGVVEQYGLYDRIHRPPDASASGAEPRANPIHFYLKTRHVPLAIGTRFGACFRIDGLEDGSPVALEKVTEHPPMREASDAYSSRPVTVQPTGGSIKQCVGYAFDHDFELVPGHWRFSIKQGGVTVVQQDFEAAPSNDTCPPLKYPAESLTLKEEGTTTIQYDVDSDGSVRNVSVLRSSGSSRLDAAAIEHAQRCRQPLDRDEDGTRLLRAYKWLLH
jgi:TonB family protein